MKIIVYSAKSYDEETLSSTNNSQHDLTFIKAQLNKVTAPLATGYDGVCVFVNDQLDEGVMKIIADGGCRLIVLRCAGFNNVDLTAAGQNKLTVARVPEYSPFSVAEHTVGMMLALNRQFPRAYNRVREGNYALKGLLGFDMHGKTVGVIGTGKIGAQVCRILQGIGCRVLAYDKFVNQSLQASGVEFVELDQLFRESNIITLHCPLTPQTHHMINKDRISEMKRGVMLINTSRGALIDTRAVLKALKSGQIGYLGLDVYEEEGPLFFEDRSDSVLEDDIFARLLTFRNVLVTGHQAFFTREALTKIAETTIENITMFDKTGTVSQMNQVN